MTEAVSQRAREAAEKAWPNRYDRHKRNAFAAGYACAERDLPTNKDETIGKLLKTLERIANTHGANAAQSMRSVANELLTSTKKEG